MGVCGVSRSSFVTPVGRSGLLLGKLVLAKTQVEAMQFAFMIMLLSALLSGFAFPRAEMPSPIYEATFLLPATYFIEILRGIVLRGAGLFDMIPWVGPCGFSHWRAIVNRNPKRQRGNHSVPPR